MRNFVNALVREGQRINSEKKTLTDNGAVAYKTTGETLLDLNFKIPELRQMPEQDLSLSFRKAFTEDPIIALRWLFYLRDVRGGMGERRSFNVIFNSLDPKLRSKLISHRVIFGNGENSESVPIIAHYGRWKDMFQYFADSPEDVKQSILTTMKFQLGLDLTGICQNRGISFMGKYMPSRSANNSVRRHNATVFAEYLGMNIRDYQDMVSTMLSYLQVPEQAMSRREWSSINFERVPSAAMRLYNKAFRRHDQERFDKYLESVKSGKAKVHSATLYPYQVLCDMMEARDKNTKDLIEEQWKNLQPFINGNRSVLFVMDGSGSMTWTYPIKDGKGISCWKIAAALTIKASETLKGGFKDTFITFSSYPQVVSLAHCRTLEEKIRVLASHDDCSNTDIEKTMKLILAVATKNNMRQEDLPDDIVLISDMQFDPARSLPGGDDSVLFERIRGLYRACGYEMPRINFWNVSHSNNTIPLKTTPGGVTLISGFSLNNYKIIATGKLDPYESLKATVLDSRYDPVEEAYTEYCRENGVEPRTNNRSYQKPMQKRRYKDGKAIVNKALKTIKG